MTNLIREVFPDTKVYAALGNHDFHPKNQFPAESNSIYRQVAELWRPWLSNQSFALFKEGAFYSEKLPGLSRAGRIVVLNTNLYYSSNEQTAGMTDPSQQFQWLGDVLSNASRDGEMVYIIGHVPPGFFEKTQDKAWFRDSFNEEYLKVVQKHHQVIAGQFFGHHHTDSFRMFYDDAGAPISVMFLTPGVTPWKTTLPGVVNGANNPGIRVFEYDRVTLNLQDMVTYFLNLSQANTQETPHWELEYRLTEAYQVQDAGTSSMHTALTRIASDQHMLQRYYVYNSVSYDHSTCGDICRIEHVCAMQQVSFNTYATCMYATGGLGAGPPRLPELGYLYRCLHGLHKGLSMWQQELPSESDLAYADFLSLDISMLRLFESFLEATPQLTLVLTIVLQSGQAEYYQWFGISSSFVGISWALLDYHRALRTCLPSKPRLGWSSSAVFFLWNLLLLWPRIFVVALFSALFPYYVVLHFLSLWLVLLFWVYLQGTKFMPGPNSEWLYRVTVAIILYFSWFNVAGGRTRGRSIIHLVFIISDSILMVSTWMAHSSWLPVETLPIWLTIGGACFLLGLLLRLFYYLWLHPNCQWQPDRVDGVRRLLPAKQSKLPFNLRATQLAQIFFPSSKAEAALPEVGEVTNAESAMLESIVVAVEVAASLAAFLPFEQV
ncbi:acid sphingomyelinase-like phosphodiesterase 3b [Sigmodon hispidus]